MALLSSISMIVVQDRTHPDAALFDRLNATMSRIAMDSEVIIVANNVTAEIVRALRPFVESIPDATCVILAAPTDPDVARLIGIDYAIGDFVVFLTPTDGELSALEELAREADDGYDLVTVVDPEATKKLKGRRLYWLLYETYFRFYSILTGRMVRPEGVTLRMLSRPAALYAANQFAGEILLKSRDIGSGFPATQLSMPGISEGTEYVRNLKEAWRKALRMLSSNAAPLRAALLVSFAAAILSLVYSIYVFVVYFFVPYVRGWTTLSLQISGMMLLFSTIFILLAEYVVQIHSTNPARWRRGLVMREWRSARTKRSARLNVVDPGGNFQVGAVHLLLQHPGRGSEAERT
ncbi:hypothetical protein [Bradyrhizobium guangzhouense]|uniref:hypothetical protein n=1 Tax=Bradyrhizobium guangzhouense TaxID=1325095 RepID=UPI001009A84C|nr:hypothetical protein [Bradyrhizobium guangzhouense]RXH19844.1 hypothetical protein EAS54_06650 [Bradyrhizobium guangzhouense]